MASLQVPSSGLVLGAIPASGTGKAAVHGLQAMRIVFADGLVLEDVLKHGSDLKISFGKSMVRDTPKQALICCHSPRTPLVRGLKAQKV